MSSEPQTQCSIHGRQGIGLVCIHVARALDSKEQVGFFCGKETDTARPDAWCSQCEANLQRLGAEGSGEWFEASGFDVICSVCWDAAQALLG